MNRLYKIITVSSLDNKEEFRSTIYSFFRDLKEFYPDFDNWFYNKVIPQLHISSDSREIILLIDKNKLTCSNNSISIIGAAILKKTSAERKICTFKISDEYKRRGFGKLLFELCFDYLETTLPIISITEDRLDMFQPLLKHYQFELKEVLEDYYINGVSEYVYNDHLIQNETASFNG